MVRAETLSRRFFGAILPSSKISHWHARIDRAYEQAQSSPQFRVGGGDGIAAFVPAGERFVSAASSFTIGALFAENEIRELFGFLKDAKVLTGAENELGDRLACDLTQSWVRRQYAPGQYPRQHAPHAWHQDGALGFNFLSYPEGQYPPDALLRMATCWIALDACGVKAPGLELITEEQTQLLPPADLADARVRQRFSAGHFWQPDMQPGDALLFKGDVLHRTYVTPAMTRNRTSIELRFFPSNHIPARLKADRFVPLE